MSMCFEKDIQFLFQDIEVCVYYDFQLFVRCFVLNEIQMCVCDDYLNVKVNFFKNNNNNIKIGLIFINIFVLEKRGIEISD